MICLPICITCKHFDNKDLEGNCCSAFPSGIPNDILSCKFVHDKKHPEQDNDIVFEEK